MNSEKIKKLGFEFKEKKGVGKSHLIFWNGDFVGWYNDEIDTMLIAHKDCPNVYTCDMKRFEDWCAQQFVDLINEKRKGRKE